MKVHGGLEHGSCARAKTWHRSQAAYHLQKKCVNDVYSTAIMDSLADLQHYDVHAVTKVDKAKIKSMLMKW